MKVIGIFSGKGGVGKSTVASLLALALAKTHKVSLVDLDINTPSIPVLFGGRQELTNLHIHSVGFLKKGLIDYSGNILRKVVRDQLDRAKADEPDIVVIDMPPGLDDTHLELVNYLRPSFFVLVIQPNKLSEEDAKRTSQLFSKVHIPVIGVIQNMSGEVFGEYQPGQVLGLNLLASIPMNKDVATLGGDGKIDELENPLQSISENLFNLAGEAEWKLINRGLWEGLSYEELVAEGLAPADFHFDGEDRYDRMRRRALFKKKGGGQVQFMGLKSWDQIREYLLDHSMVLGAFNHDATLEYCDTETIRKMLYHLDETNMGLFMVIRPPNTAIRLYPGEIGTARLYTEGSHYYNLPRVAYQTDEGEVVLFPHEVSPVSVEKLHQYVEEFLLVLAKHSKTPRYVPKKDQLEIINNTFGHHVGLVGDWEQDYKDLCGVDEA